MKSFHHHIVLVWLLVLILPAPKFGFAQQTDEGVDLAAVHSASLPFDNTFMEANRAMMIANYTEALDYLRQCMALKPNEASVHHLMAKAYKELERPDEAIFHAGEAVRLNPQNHWYYVAQAEIYEKYNYFRQAADALMSASSLVTKGSEGLQLQAVDLYIQGMEYKTALKVLDQLEKKVGYDDDITRRRYNVLIKMGKRKKAEKLLERLKEEKPESDMLRGALLNHYKYFKQVKKTEKLLLEWTAFDPTNGEVWIELGNLYAENQQPAKAIEAYKKAIRATNLDARKRVEILLFVSSRYTSITFDEIKELSVFIAQKHPYAPEPQALLGDVLAKEGSRIEAIQAYQRTLRNGGDKESVYQQLILLLSEEGRNAEALTYAQECIQKYPDNLLGYAIGAMSAFQLSQYDKAVELAEAGLPKAIGNKPLKFQLTYVLAESYHKLGNNPASDEYFEKALNIDPNNISALNNFAYYLAERGEKLDKALMLITRANKLQPANATLLDTWAWVLYKRGEYTDALVKIQKAIENGGSEVSVIQEHYGDILHKLGFYSQALAAYSAALETAKDKDHLLLKIRNTPNR
ncbi:tetratricopeptide repeat protein [Thermaurantimonas aggregans]|uniref:tetratricopeptide repeat protein n=1 Tax=Thermaurantimonas aggregans TaxID=2173829 RepID=UPI000F57BA11|nr:tetratricopeptide repeat protein [Thermaurantimonas aggregans]